MSGCYKVCIPGVGIRTNRLDPTLMPTPQTGQPSPYRGFLLDLAVSARDSVDSMLAADRTGATCAYCRLPKKSDADTCKHCGATENLEGR